MTEPTVKWKAATKMPIDYLRIGKHNCAKGEKLVDMENEFFDETRNSFWANGNMHLPSFQ